MKAKPGDSRLGSDHQSNFQKAILIKKHMLRIHDEIKAEGIYPTLRKILRAMPFHVGQTWGCELRRELIEEGLIPEPPRGIKNTPQQCVEWNNASAPSLEEIEERKLEIKEEYFALLKDDDGDDESDQMTPSQASEWARARYKAVWESVEAISRHRNRWRFLAHPETVEVC